MQVDERKQGRETCLRKFGCLCRRLERTSLPKVTEISPKFQPFPRPAKSGCYYSTAVYSIEWSVSLCEKYRCISRTRPYLSYGDLSASLQLLFRTIICGFQVHISICINRSNSQSFSSLVAFSVSPSTSRCLAMNVAQAQTLEDIGAVVYYNVISNIVSWVSYGENSIVWIKKWLISMYCRLFHISCNSRILPLSVCALHLSSAWHIFQLNRTINPDRRGYIYKTILGHFCWCPCSFCLLWPHGGILIYQQSV